MPFLSISSYISSSDSQGSRYWLSIDVLSCKKCQQCPKTVQYVAQAYANQPLDHGDRRLVQAVFLKASRDNQEALEFATSALRVYSLSQEAALKFNLLLEHMRAARRQSRERRTSNNYDNIIITDNDNDFCTGDENSNDITVDAKEDDNVCRKIHFQEILMAQVRSRSSRDRRENEYFVFGDKLSKCQTFCSHSGRGDGLHPLNSGHSDYHWCLDAFVHYFHTFTKGEAVVEGFCGKHSSREGYTLKTPTVHSLKREFGPTDEGTQGMLRVIRKHRCNPYCSHFISMSKLFNEAQETQLNSVTATHHSLHL